MMLKTMSRQKTPPDIYCPIANAMMAKTENRIIPKMLFSFTTCGSSGSGLVNIFSFFINRLMMTGIHKRSPKATLIRIIWGSSLYASFSFIFIQRTLILTRLGNKLRLQNGRCPSRVQDLVVHLLLVWWSEIHFSEFDYKFSF